MAYTNGNGVVHYRRTCRRLHNTGRRIRRIDTAGGRESCPHCTDGTDAGDGQTETELDIAGMIDDERCPWCSDYTGDHVGRHASSAHPDEWKAYREGDE